MHEIEFSPDDRILIVAPHPDDECIGTGGVLLMQPDLCEVIVATDGSLADRRITTDTMIRIRQEELMTAMDTADVKKCRMLGIPDGELMRHPDFMSEIELKQYSKIFVPYQNEGHPDHMAAFIYVVDELRRQEADKVELYQYETRGNIEGVSDYIDITDVIEKKQELIRCYDSQMRLFDHAAFIAGINAGHAEGSGKQGRYFEAFIRTDHCEITVRRDHSKEAMIASYRRKYEFMASWLELKTAGYEIAGYLNHCEAKNIAIYGFGELGKLLYRDLQGGETEVRFVIDRKAVSDKDCDLPILHPKEEHPEADMVIVTVLYGFPDIRTELEGLGYQRIMSIRDLFVMTGYYYRGEAVM